MRPAGETQRELIKGDWLRTPPDKNLPKCVVRSVPATFYQRTTRWPAALLAGMGRGQHRDATFSDYS